MKVPIVRTDTGQPLQPAAPLSPQQAAAVRWGQTLNVDGTATKVSELFQSTIRQVESPEASDLNPGDVFFGFTGRTQNAQLLVRWNAKPSPTIRIMMPLT
jgi:hypothetical protein